MNFKEVPESNWFKFKTVNDVIEGHVEKIWTQTGGEYGDQRVVDLRTSDGAVWSVGAVGDMKSKAQKLATKDYVRFTYVGDRQGNTGSFKSIKVEVADSAPTPPPPAANQPPAAKAGDAPF